MKENSNNNTPQSLTGKDLSNLNSVNQTTVQKSAFIPRATIDTQVDQLTEIGKQIKEVKAILTQSKIKKQHFDLNRFETNLNLIKNKLSTMIKYSKKSSEPPKKKAVKTVVEATTSTTVSTESPSEEV